MTSALVLLLSVSAFAQDGYDAHGFDLVPGSGDTTDALGVYSATAVEAGNWSASAVFEYADNPLTLTTRDLVTGNTSDSTLLDDLFGVNLGGSYALLSRVSLAAALPLWFTSTGEDGPQGASFGDLRLSAPVSLLKRDPSELDLGLAIIPGLTLPTGAGERFLGDDGLGLNAVAALTVGAERWSLSANAGLDRRSRTGDALSEVYLRGGLYAVGGLAAGVDVVERLGLVGELRGRAPLGEHASASLESPVEATLSARYKSDSGLGVVVGGAKGLAGGAGAADYRAFAGLTFGRRAEAPVVEAADANLLVTVTEPDGDPIVGARVRLDGRELVADAAGQARFADLEPGDELPVGATATAFAPTEETVRLVEGDNARVLVLDPLDGTLKVIAIDPRGEAVEARVRFLSGPEDHAMEPLGPDGEGTFELAPGDWRVLVAADDHVPEERGVSLEPAEFETLVVTFSDEERLDVCTEKVVLQNVHFDFDIDEPRPEALPVLASLARTLLDCPDITLEVGGHTDWIDTDEYNIDLSQRRMNSVKRILVEHGVASSRLIPVGFGESRPIAPNTTDEGRALNRRVEFTPVPAMSDR